jgi:cytoskeletal protein RodZ
MSTVAEQLRAARAAKNLTVEQVAESTKIRTDHIRALEEGNFDVFSAPIYIRGSVKNYARLLKLDIVQVLAALDAELGRTENYSEPPPLSDESHKPLDRVTFLLAKLNLKWVLAVVVILLVIGIGSLVHAILKHGHKISPTGNLPPARYEPANAGDTLPLPKK